METDEIPLATTQRKWTKLDLFLYHKSALTIQMKISDLIMNNQDEIRVRIYKAAGQLIKERFSCATCQHFRKKFS